MFLTTSSYPKLINLYTQFNLSISYIFGIKQTKKDKNRKLMEKSPSN